MNALDLQVNGYAGVDFNSESINENELHHACQALHDDGVEGILATVITDSIESMCKRLEKLTRIRDSNPLCAEIIVGFHIEGPFLNQSPGYIGAHPAAQAKQANTEDMKRLLDAANGYTKLVTLAPERDHLSKTTSFLSELGITVAAGHCNPTTDELMAGIDCGLSMFTHLGNGCPMQLERHDNIIQRVLSLSDSLWVSFIPDGLHVPFSALKNYLKIVPSERAIAVTDAISAARMGPGKYTIGKWRINIGTDGTAMAPDRSHLIGSTLTVPQIIENLGDSVGLESTQIQAMLYTNPLAAVNS